jgi:hypothetical protein
MLDLGYWFFSCAQGSKREPKEYLQRFDIKELGKEDHRKQGTFINFFYISRTIKYIFIEVMF